MARSESKAAEALRAIKCYNTWDLLLHFGDAVDCAIEYHASPAGRMGWGSTRHSRVWSPLHDKSGRSWKRDFQGPRAESFLAACNYAAERTQRKLVVNPFGGRITEECLAKANAAVKAGTILPRE